MFEGVKIFALVVGISWVDAVDDDFILFLKDGECLFNIRSNYLFFLCFCFTAFHKEFKEILKQLMHNQRIAFHIFLTKSIKNNNTKFLLIAILHTFLYLHILFIDNNILSQKLAGKDEIGHLNERL